MSEFGNINADLNGQAGAPVQYGKSDGNLVRFDWEAIENKSLSKEKGHPVYEDRPFVYISAVGGKDIHAREIKKSVYSGEYEDPAITEAPRAWQAFIHGREHRESGLPLCNWAHPEMTKGKVKTFEHQGVYTVEQLAGVSDTGLQVLGVGARAIQKAAKQYLEEAKAGQGVNKLAAELESEKEKNELLQKQLNELAEKVEGLGQEKPKKRKK